MPRSIQKKYPDIFCDWHPTLNGNLNPSTVRRTSRKKYWWKCHKKRCGHNWQATIYARLRLGDVCPKCAAKKKIFSKELEDIKKIFKKIKKIQLQQGKQIEVFTSDNSNKASLQRSSVSIRRAVESINKLGLELRNIILNYKKKMLIKKRRKYGQRKNLHR